MRAREARRWRTHAGECRDAAADRDVFPADGERGYVDGRDLAAGLAREHRPAKIDRGSDFGSSGRGGGDEESKHECFNERPS